jgi:hypothetical protein
MSNSNPRSGSLHRPQSPSIYFPQYPFGLDSLLGVSNPSLPVTTTSSSPLPMELTAFTFVVNHTKPSNPHASMDDCPICLESYTMETCLQVIGIAGCSHHIGSTCLQKMLEHLPEDEKKCPLCRAVWIPGAAPVFPARGRSLAISRMTDTFRAVNGIGPSIANSQRRNECAPNSYNQLASRYTPCPRAGNIGDVRQSNVHAGSQEGGHSEPIVIESSSEAEDSMGEEDYATEVQNFTTLTRDIAEIRRRAENTQYRRRRNRYQNQPQHVHEEAQSGSGSDNRRFEPRKRRGAISSGTPAASALNRLMNARTFNPFRATVNAAAPSAAAMSEGFNDDGVQGMARTQYRPGVCDIQHHGTTNHRMVGINQKQNNISSSIASASLYALAHAPSLSEDVEMTGARTGIQRPHYRFTDSPRTLDARVQRLDQREQALDARDANLTQQEAALLERERRAENMFELVRRQRREVEELLRRQMEELNRILD